jgi:3-hydroxybutyryl-CoA dehydrogenase
MTDKNRVAVIGAGLMGPGIAACAALAGHPTVLFDTTAKKGEEGVARALEHVAQLRDNQLASPQQAAMAGELLSAGTNQAAYTADTFLVVEAINENLALKQALFQRMDAIFPPDVILASNTSSLRITQIAQQMIHPERAVTAHFWFPPHLVPLVEVVVGERTELAVAEALRDVLLCWGKVPVLVRRDLPGQLANRILQAVIREATYIVESGLASAEDVDTAIKMGMGIRFPAWGALEHIDAVGLDLALSVQRDVLPGLCSSTVPVQHLQNLVASGCLGHKTGGGFYNWHEKDMQQLVERRDRFIISALRILHANEERRDNCENSQTRQKE